jgi:hypothetical protein
MISDSIDQGKPFDRLNPKYNLVQFMKCQVLREAIHKRFDAQEELIAETEETKEPFRSGSSESDSEVDTGQSEAVNKSLAAG